NQAVLSLEPGDVSVPQSVLGNLVVFQVVSRSPFDEAAYEEQKAGIKEQILQTRRDQFFQEYIQTVRDELEQRNRIQIKSDVLEQAIQFI
ncbi:MAG TPA: hypothetical protein VLL97_05365, partial [Acidobacteriota bacterium]|nr:hypothetical protein [Acidobacteriota bacterium]